MSRYSLDFFDPDALLRLWHKENYADETEPHLRQTLETMKETSICLLCTRPEKIKPNLIRDSIVVLSTLQRIKSIGLPPHKRGKVKVASGLVLRTHAVRQDPDKPAAAYEEFKTQATYAWMLED